MRRSFRSRVLPVPPPQLRRGGPRRGGIVDRAPEDVEQTAILRAVLPAHASVETLGTPSLQIGYAADPETPEIGRHAGSDAGNPLQLVPRGTAPRGHRTSMSC